MDKIKQRRESAERRAVYQRNYRRARDRALARLSRDYPNVYHEYLYEELEADEKMGNNWISISGHSRSIRVRS